MVFITVGLVITENSSKTGIFMITLCFALSYGIKYFQSTKELSFTMWIRYKMWGAFWGSILKKADMSCSLVHINPNNQFWDKNKLCTNPVKYCGIVTILAAQYSKLFLVHEKDNIIMVICPKIILRNCIKDLSWLNERIKRIDYQNLSLLKVK